MQALMQALPFFSNLLFQRDDKKKQGTEEIRLKHSASHKTGSIALSNGRERLFACVCVCEICVKEKR